MRNLGAFGSVEELDRAIIESVEGDRITCVAAMYMGSYTSIFALNIPYYNGQESSYVQWVFRAMDNKRTFFSRIIYWDSPTGKYRTRGKKDIQNENI